MKNKLKYLYGSVLVWVMIGCGVAPTPPSPDEFSSYKNQCVKSDDDGSSCYILGNMYKDGIGTSKNMYLAQKSYKKACEKNNNNACLELGKTYSDNKKNKNVPTEQIKQEEIGLKASQFEVDKRACKAGNFEKCYVVGQMYEREIGTTKDYKKASKAYTKSCENRHKYTLNACYALGRLHSDGLGVRQNYKRAKRLFKHTCKSTYKKGCGNLGHMYLSGQGGEQNYTQAIKFLEIGCKNNSVKSCTTLGTIFVTGDGVNENYTRAHDYFDRACSKGDRLACYNMGNIYENGIGRAQNKQTAKAFYRSACSSGLQESCVSFKMLEEKM